MLNLKGAMITLDAMGTQIDIARQIQQAGGDYVLAVKGNQGLLSQQVEDWFQQAHAHNWQGIEYRALHILGMILFLHITESRL